MSNIELLVLNRTTWNVLNVRLNLIIVIFANMRCAFTLHLGVVAI